MPGALEITFKRLIDQEDIVCPAGEALGGCAVFCGVEQTVIDGYLNPSTPEAFCTGDNAECPSWRKEKEAIAEGFDGALDRIRKTSKQPHKATRTGLKERGIHLEDRERDPEVLERRAKELLFGNSVEARKFRRRTGLDRQP